MVRNEDIAFPNTENTCCLHTTDCLTRMLQDFFKQFKYIKIKLAVSTKIISIMLQLYKFAV